MNPEEAPPKVVVVEDEALLRLDLACAFADAELAAIAVSNAEHALTVLSILPDVEAIITDVELFGTVDGVELSWRVHDRWPPIHIFVISGRSRADELELPERSQFFAKPLRMDRLVHVVRELLTQ